MYSHHSGPLVLPCMQTSISSEALECLETQHSPTQGGVYCPLLDVTFVLRTMAVLPAAVSSILLLPPMAVLLLLTFHTRGG